MSDKTTPAPYSVTVPTSAYYRDLVSCRTTCPVGTDAGAYVRAIARGDYERAYHIAAEVNPLASVCGRICAHPCEAACRRGTLDEPVAIRALKRFAAEQAGVERSGYGTRTRPPDDSGPRIAIVGAGPAGIACADVLGRAGIAATIFEAAPVPGGMLMLGIPEYRLPRDILRMEIYRVLSRGVELKTGWSLGKDFTLNDLLADGYAAVFLAIGAGLGRTLDLPGSELDGVIDGIEFLLNVNQGYHLDVGKRVAIIGGGNVAMDAARTALRAGAEPQREAGGQAVVDAARSAIRVGAREVHVFALESRAELPAWAEEIHEAEVEGITLHTSFGPKAFHGDQGRLQELETMAVERVFDDEGRFAPRFVPDSERRWPFDTIITCVGQRVDTDMIDRAGGLEISDRGFVAVDPDTLMTSNPRVFCGGDAASGPRIAIDAIADGRRAARSIMRLLGKHPPPHRVSKMTVVDWDRSGDNFDCLPRVDPPTVALGRRSGFREVEDSYTEASAREQAARCFRCHLATVFDSDRCIGCGGCIDICPERCLRLTATTNLLGPLVPELVEARLGREPGFAIVKDESNCTRCGLCALRCPVRAITFESLEECP